MLALLLYLCCAAVCITTELFDVCMDYNFLLLVLMNLDGEELKVLYLYYIIFKMVVTLKPK